MKFILIAFLSAFLFGSSTPLGKLLLDQLSPFQLAGLLYLGAAMGVLPFCLKRKHLKIDKLDRKNRFRLSTAIFTGGIAGPVLLLFGLRLASASSVAMWLNLELVFTVILGLFIFRDYIGISGWTGVVAVLIASVILTRFEGSIGLNGFILIAGASLCWGLDNHLTALIDGLTPSQSTFWKGLVAGSMNLIIGLIIEPFDSKILIILLALVLGILAYGYSITLYIYSAQNLGATRSQMIFASAPFFGVILSIPLLGEVLTLQQIVPFFIFIMGVLFLMRDRHTHSHSHEVKCHKHNHQHDDEHHDHLHPQEELNTGHSHWHKHRPVTHSHPHWPDMHHRHKHQTE